MEKYQRVLELMKAKGGRLDVDDPELKTLLGHGMEKGNVHYRLSTYISFIRRFANLKVTGIRGNTPETARKVVTYQLDAMAQEPPASTPDSPTTAT